jgi:hypothetical protein
MILRGFIEFSFIYEYGLKWFVSLLTRICRGGS